MIHNLPKQNDVLAKRLAGYAASAGAMMALAPHVNAQVVYSGIQNVQLNTPSDSIEIDLNDDAVMDFKFKVYGYSYLYTYGQYFYKSAFGYALIINPKTDTYKNSWIDRMTTMRTFYYTNSQIYTYSYFNPIVNGLPAGVMVDAAQTMWTNISYSSYAGVLGMGALYSYYYGTSYMYSYAWGYGDFFDQTRFIGVRFYIGNDQHYGWIRVHLGEYIDPVTLIDWAYESSPGVGILTGSGGDLTAPVATLDPGLSETPEQTINVQVSFSEEITGLSIDDFSISNGTAANLTEVQAGTEYSIEVTADAGGNVIVELPAESVFDESGNGNDPASASWNYSPTDLLSHNDHPHFALYPNPADNMLRIVLKTQADIMLFNSMGKAVLQRSQVLDESLDVSHLSPGIYIIQIKNDQRTFREKVVIN